MSELIQQLVEMEFGYQLLLGAVLLFLFIQLYYYFYYFAAPIRKLKKDFSTKSSGKRPNVSIIVCAQNEQENLQAFIPKLLSQKYSAKFEVVVVNDGSTDDSIDVLERLAQEHSNLKISFLPKAAKYMSRKKMCLSIGIKAAAYDTLVFTDADCKPTSDLWLDSIARHHSNENNVVLGASRVEKTEGMIGELIDYDNLFSTMQYMGYAICGNPFRGTILNLSYTKGVYYKAKGFSQHLNLESGEDDIILNDANVQNAEVELSAGSIIVSNRALTPNSYRHAKEQRLDNKKRYSTSIRTSLFIERASRMLFYLTTLVAILLLGISTQWVGFGIAVLAFLLRYLVQYYVLSNNSKWLGTPNHPFGQIFFDFYLPIYEFYINTIGRIGRKKWEMWRE